MMRTSATTVRVAASLIAPLQVAPGIKGHFHEVIARIAGLDIGQDAGGGGGPGNLGERTKSLFKKQVI
jgi:hypothetical protein